MTLQAPEGGAAEPPVANVERVQLSEDRRWVPNVSRLGPSERSNSLTREIDHPDRDKVRAKLRAPVREAALAG